MNEKICKDKCIMFSIYKLKRHFYTNRKTNMRIINKKHLMLLKTYKNQAFKHS